MTAHESTQMQIRTTTPIQTDVVPAEALVGLPAPVQRYMNYTGVVGTPWIKTVRLTYSGLFRMAAGRPWMPITTESFYTTDPPGLVWDARLKMFGLPLFRGHDTYKNGHGHMFGKVAGLFTVFDVRGDELDQGAMVRYCQEASWFPTVFLSKYFSWTAVNDYVAEVTFTDAGRSVTGRIWVDDEGRLMNFTAQRYSLSNGKYSLDSWATPVISYGTRNGLHMGMSGVAVWKYADEDLPYADITLDEIEYNVPIPTF